MKFIKWRIKPDSKRRIVIPLPAFKSLELDSSDGSSEIEIKKKENQLILSRPNGNGEEVKISRNIKEVL